MKSSIAFVNATQPFSDMPITGLDRASGTVCVQFLLSFNYRVAESELLNALSDSLEVYPLLSGRVVKRPDGVICITSSAEGLAWRCVERKLPMPTFGYRNTLKKQKDYAVDLGMQVVGKNKPIAAIQVNYFDDGMVVGLSFCHYVMDADAAWAFLIDWSARVRGAEPVVSPLLDRQQWLGIVDGICGKQPSSDNPVTKLSPVKLVLLYSRLLLASLRTANIVYHISADYLQQHKQRVIAGLSADEWVSTLDVASGLLVDAISKTLPSQSSEVLVGSLHNVREFEGLRLPKSYFANAVIARAEPIPKQGDMVASVARSCRSASQQMNLQALKKDIAFFEEKKRDNTLKYYVNDSVRACFDNGVLINNYAKFPIYQVDFGGGAAVWCDYPASPLPQLAAINPDPNGDGVAVHLTLKKSHLKRLLALSVEQRHFSVYDVT